ncbi:MAG: TCR/Tet family MFS transporter [Parvibaculaceae bacterium]
MLDTATARRALIFVFVTLLLDVMGIAIIIPVMPSLLAELTHLDLGNAAIAGGWLIFAYALMQFICAPLIGNLSDRYGRRPILLVSVFTFALDNLICALAPTLAWLYLGRILAGASGGSFTTASALLADVSTDETRARNFGLIGMAFGVGFIIGPVLGGLLGEIGSRVPFYGAAALAFVNFLFGLAFLPETLPRENRRPFSLLRANPLGALLQMRKHPELLWIGLIFFLIELAGMTHPAIFAFMAKYRYGWSEGHVGLALSVVGVASVVTLGYIMPRMVKAIGEYRTAIVGLVVGIAGYLAYGTAWQGWMVYAIIVFSAPVGIVDPILRSMSSAKLPLNEQGELQGAMSSLMSIVMVLCPIIATQLFGHFTAPGAPLILPGAPYYAAAIMQLAALVIFLWMMRRPAAA